jgi:hypothetical protein
MAKQPASTVRVILSPSPTNSALIFRDLGLSLDEVESHELDYGFTLFVVESLPHNADQIIHDYGWLSTMTPREIEYYLTSTRRTKLDPVRLFPNHE